MSTPRGSHASVGGGSHGGGSHGGGGNTRANTLDLSNHVDHLVIVKLSGGRQVRGILKGWDPLVNLVLDETIEELRDETDAYKPSGMERKLGLIVARGTSVMTISPADGVGVLHENPFVSEGPEA
ncbi:hypothetical protein MMPV_004981 [Pyropia vietnamensis]